MSRAIIVTGATGTQGGALIQALLNANADLEIVAVSRDPTSKSAQKLAQKSSKIKVISGNMEKAEEIFIEAKKKTTTPIWGFYSVQAVQNSLWDEPETRQGKALVDAALKNNVEMFVYSSVDRGGDASYDNPTYVPHFKTKHEIEHHLVETSKGTNMSYTILRPVAFMNNFQPGFITKAFATMWKISIDPKPLQLIAASDIGHFGAQAFLNPAEYKNRAISLAGDELTLDQVNEVFQSVTGEQLPMTYHFVARLFLLLSKDMSLMLKWLSTQGYGVDTAELKKAHPGLKSFRDFMEQESHFASKDGSKGKAT